MTVPIDQMSPQEAYAAGQQHMYDQVQGILNVLAKEMAKGNRRTQGRGVTAALERLDDLIPRRLRGDAVPPDMNWPIGVLDLGTRAYNALRNYGNIRTLDQLVDHTWEDLFDLRGFGPDCYKQVTNALAEWGLRLRDSDRPAPLTSAS